MSDKSKKSNKKKKAIITRQLLHSCIAKYIFVVANIGMTSEVNHFTLLKEAKRAFGEIARDHRYRPSEINGSDKYDISIWKWTEDRYENIFYYA